MGRVLATVAAAILLFAGAVWYSQVLPPPQASYSGLEFAAMSAADEARTPLLAKGAAVADVAPGSPADKAGIKPGEVVAAMDGQPVISARRAEERLRGYRAGQRAVLTLYDLTKGEVKPRQVAILLDVLPDPKQTRTYSVRPPRTLAKEVFALPPIAANAAWSHLLSRGAFLKPIALNGLGAGRCNGLAPERWFVAGHAEDGSLFHVMAPANFQHAIILTAPLAGKSVGDFIRATLQETFGAPASLSPPQEQPFGFFRTAWGSERGAAGFVVWREQGGRIQLWIAAVAAAESSWALPVTGAVAFSLNCGPAALPRDPALAVTAVSAQCLGGKCQESDFAASYMETLRMGYVHDPKGRTFLINPRRDVWANGAKGPGYYHQVSGENEKLEPGRTNDATAPSP